MCGSCISQCNASFYLCLSLYLPLSLSVIFILFAAQRPHHLSTELRAVILSALTRRVLPDAHLEMG